MAYEKWIWTELLAFDNQSSDQGAAAYLERIGFVPAGICIMMSTHDWILQHDGLDKEIVLPPEVCSRRGQPGNEERRRQAWTNFQLKSLVDNLRKAGVSAYISSFTGYLLNKFHKEWVSDHPEVLVERDYFGRGPAINCLRRLKDGGYYEDFFIPQTRRVVDDYGFAGWHGADGHGPLGGSLPYVDCSDDMMGQFGAWLREDLPEIAACNSSARIPTVLTLQERMQWIWAHKRREWIAFNAWRWAGFWKKMTDTLHAGGKKNLINSAWTRACFEAYYRYGIDYRQIAATGVDYMVVETVAANMSLSIHPPDKHCDYLAMLLEIKAFVPDMKLIFLHGVKDVLEEYDLLRHAPTALEREVFSLANVYYQPPQGDIRRAVDGLMVCLGDGIQPDEWRWLKKRWDVAFDAHPTAAGGVTLLWSDAVFDRQVDDYMDGGAWSSHRIAWHLMERGVQIQSAARMDALDRLQGAVLAPAWHLLTPEEKRRALDYQNGPLIMFGDIADDELNNAAVVIRHGTWACLILNTNARRQALSLPYDGAKFVEKKVPLGFKEEISWRELPDVFWDRAADSISAAIRGCAAAATDVAVWTANEQVLLTTLAVAPGVVHVAVKNKSLVYVKPVIEVSRAVKSVRTLGGYPYTPIMPAGNQFSVRVPGRGIAILECVTQDRQGGGMPATQSARGRHEPEKSS